MLVNYEYIKLADSILTIEKKINMLKSENVDLEEKYASLSSYLQIDKQAKQLQFKQPLQNQHLIYTK